VSLATIEDCDRELARVSARLHELELYPDLNRKQIQQLTRERGRALKRRIELQHSDLFDPCPKKNS
jgi:hypothetical protein